MKNERYQTITLSDRVIVIDKRKPKLKECIVCVQDGIISESRGITLINEIGICEFEEGNDGSIWHPVIASCPPIEGVAEFVVEPNKEDDIDKLGDEYVKGIVYNKTLPKGLVELAKRDFIEGYKSAKQKVSFSEADIIALVKFSREYFLNINESYICSDKFLFDNFIQSLKQSQFIVEEEPDEKYGRFDEQEKVATVYKPKIIANKLFGHWETK